MISADIQTVLPEIVLALYAMLALLAAVYTGKDATASLLTWGTAAVMVVLDRLYGLDKILVGGK